MEIALGFLLLQICTMSYNFVLCIGEGKPEDTDCLLSAVQTEWAHIFQSFRFLIIGLPLPTWVPSVRQSNIHHKVPMRVVETFISHKVIRIFAIFSRDREFCRDWRLHTRD